MIGDSGRRRSPWPVLIASSAASVVFVLGIGVVAWLTRDRAAAVPQTRVPPPVAADAGAPPQSAGEASPAEPAADGGSAGGLATPDAGPAVVDAGAPRRAAPLDVVAFLEPHRTALLRCFEESIERDPGAGATAALGVFVEDGALAYVEVLRSPSPFFRPCVRRTVAPPPPPGGPPTGSVTARHQGSSVVLSRP